MNHKKKTDETMVSRKRLALGLLLPTGIIVLQFSTLSKQIKITKLNNYNLCTFMLNVRPNDREFFENSIFGVESTMFLEN